VDMDDIKAAWRELERRVDTGLALQRDSMKRLELDRTRTALRRLGRGPLFELVSGLAALMLLGGFLADHIGTARFAIPAIALQAFVLFTVVSAGRQLAIIWGIDYAAPVVAIQRDLARLRALRVRTTLWVLLLAPLVWTPLAIVAARGLLGADLYRVPGPLWLAVNLAFGLAVIPLAVWLSRRHAQRLRGSRFLSRLADDIAGRNLAAAVGSLQAIQEFETEG